MYTFLISLTIAILISYWIVLHHKKEDINNWIDTNAPLWITGCRFCRGYWFGVIKGILISAAVTLFLLRAGVLSLNL